ncbi:MAG: hypothetical protein JWM59_3384 [Verrucomicrobiales bacterium]|nr:hypothetical protein [Verrucomicrobiales bacterium]
MGFPSFFLVRTWERYAAVIADYRAAVGLLPRKPFFENDRFRNSWIRNWVWIYLASILGSHASSALGFSILVLACAGVAFYFFHRAWASWTLLRVNPGLERRLKRVPITEICTFGTAALMALIIFHNIVEQGPPKASPSPIISQASSRL